MKKEKVIPKTDIIDDKMLVCTEHQHYDYI